MTNTPALAYKNADTMKPTIYTVIIIVVVIALMWVSAAEKNTPVNRAVTRVEISAEMYDAIQPGMTIEEVVEVMGAPPAKKEVNQSPRGNQLRATWISTEGYAVYIYGIDNKVTEKGNTWPTPSAEGLAEAY